MLQTWWPEIKQDIVALWPDWHRLIARLRHKWKTVLGVGVIFAGLYGLGVIMPLGFDWKNFFSQGILPGYFMPWTLPIIKYLNWPALFAITILGLVWRAQRYQASPLTLGLIVGSWPVIWVVFFLGNIDGLTILGLLLLPWGVPLVLLKPQVAAFALLANRRTWIVTAIWLVISIALWGWWPGRIGLMINDPNWRAEWPQDITLYPWGLILALPLLWFSRGDEDLLMAAGSLGTPHIFPYHFIVLMPALARMTWPWRIITWVLTWMPLMANWLGPIGWHFGNLASLAFWFGIYLNKRAKRLRAINPVENKLVPQQSGPQTS